MSLFYFSRLVITFANFFLHKKMKFLPTGSGSKRSPRRLWIRSILKCGFGNTDWHVRLGFQHAAQLGHILYTRTVHIMISLLIHGNTAIHLTPPPLVLRPVGKKQSAGNVVSKAGIRKPNPRDPAHLAGSDPSPIQNWVVPAQMTHFPGKFRNYSCKI